MAISGELVRLYHPDDKPEGVDKDSVALEVDADYLGVVDEILVGLVDDKKSEVVTDQFRRCCAEVFKLVDLERSAQGRDLYGNNQRIIFVYEMYRTAKLYKDKTRKDGTSVFYSHLIGTVKNVICDLGLTGVVSLLAMLKHDMVEDFVDKDELEKAGKEEALRRVKDMAALIALGEAADRPGRDVVGKVREHERSLRLVVDEICGDFAAEVKEVLAASVVQAPTGRDRKAVDNKLVSDIRAVASKRVTLRELRRRPQDGDMFKAERELNVALKRARSRFEQYVSHVSQSASGRARTRKETELYETLLDMGMYRDRIDGYDETLAEMVRQEVRELVNGLTKLRKRDRVKTLEATVFHHLSQVRTYPRAALLKAGGDRPHNTATIKGHRPAKAGTIMKETELAYVPETDIFKIRRALRRLVYDCVKFFNPTLLKRYDKTLDARLRSRLNKGLRDGILGCFSETSGGLFGAALDRIANVQFIPRGLDYYTRRAPKKGFADLKFEDLAIDALDPMFEILVTTKVDESEVGQVKQLEDDIKSLRNRRAMVLHKAAEKRDKTGSLDSTKESIDDRLARLGDLNYPQLQELASDIKTFIDEKLSALNAFRLASMSGAMAYIIDKFAKHGGYDVQADFTVRGVDDPNKIFGIVLTLFNEKFGGQLQFRINDVCAEARSKRGVIAETGNIPADLKAMIGVAIDKTFGRMQGARGIEALRAEVFAPRITVKTMSGESREFPIGATGFDFAGSIHGDILVGAQKIFEKDAVISRMPAREVSLWDELHAGKVYIVESCKPDAKKVKAGLKWLLFTQSSAGNYLRRHFGHLNVRERLTMSRAHLRELAQVYNIDYAYIRDVLIRNFAGKFIHDDEYGDIPDRGAFLEKVFYSDNDPQAVKVRRRIWERILNSIGEGDINPVLVLSQKCEANVSDWRHAVHRDIKFIKKRRGAYRADSATAARWIVALEKAEEGSGKWEVEVEVPEDIGSLSAFSAEFSREAGISIYHMKEHVIGALSGAGKKGRPGMLKLVFDLKNSKVSQYEFFRKLLKLSFRYKVRVVDKMQVKYDKRRVGDIRRKDDSSDRALAAGPVNPPSRQLELFRNQR